MILVWQFVKLEFPTKHYYDELRHRVCTYTCEVFLQVHYCIMHHMRIQCSVGRNEK